MLTKEGSNVRDTFRGGVHPREHKELSKEASLRVFDAKGEMVFPLAQHIGKPAKAIVKKGDPVLVGQCIAEADGFVSANVISSCSGTVKAVEKRRTIAGALLAPKEPLKIKYLIANGAECEPYITCNDQLMRGYGNQIVEGMEIMLRLFPNAEGVIAIEGNKPEAIAAMEMAVKGHPRMRVQKLRTKYPQGGERSLISVIAGVDYPTSKLPADVGCIVDNVGTIYAVGRAVLYNEPLFRHVITVTGEGVRNPSNFIARDGTSFAEMIEAAGGLKEGADPKKVISGGPMMGLAVSTLDVPITKTTNAVTVLLSDEVEKAELKMTACLHCGRCTTVCPNGLMPQMMADAIVAGDMERYEKKLYGLDCIFCGSCTYICPAKRPLTQNFKQTKAEILAKKRAAQAAQGGGK